MNILRKVTDSVCYLLIRCLGSAVRLASPGRIRRSRACQQLRLQVSSI